LHHQSCCLLLHLSHAPLVVPLVACATCCAIGHTHLLLHLSHARSVAPPIACAVHRALSRTIGRAACCPHCMSHCLSGAPSVSHPSPVLLVALPPVAHAVLHHLSGAPSVMPPVACAVCRAICCTACHAACCPCCLSHHPSPVLSVVLPVAHAVSHSHSMSCAPSVTPSVACAVVPSVVPPVACVTSRTTCQVHRLSGHPSPTPVACGDLYTESGESKKIGATHLLVLARGIAADTSTSPHGGGQH